MVETVLSIHSSHRLTILNALLYPPTHVTLQQWSWAPFLAMQLVWFGLLYTYLPETGGKSVDEIVDQWMRDEDRTTQADEEPGSDEESESSDDDYYDNDKYRERRPLLMDWDVLRAAESCTIEGTYYATM